MGRAGVPDVRAARARVRGRFLAVPDLTIRPLAAADLPWAAAFLGETLGSRLQARRGELVDVLDGFGVIAEIRGRGVGLVTWARPQAHASERADGADGAEVRAVAVAESARGRGVGRALLAAAEAELHGAGVRRAWLVTTNDNLTALALYQKAGWRITTLRAGAIDEARQALKPSLPESGQHGIPLRDELELTKDL